MRLFTLSTLFTLFFCVQGRVLFPEELVSLFSFLYSIFPPVKVGQDSRIGAGFRVGPNADFQVLLELGPQSETQPIGPNTDSSREIRANSVNDTESRNKMKNYGKKWKVNKKKVHTYILNKNISKTNDTL